MVKFNVVPDYLREAGTSRKGRVPSSALSRALLNGQTIFVEGPRKTWGSLYTLARNHGQICRTSRRMIRDSSGSHEGTLIWFEEVK